MLLALHATITWALAALLWHVQLVRYPRFHQIPSAGFSRHHFGHCLRITLQVVPLILAEALTAAWLLWSGQHSLLFLASLALMVLSWLSTALFQAPIHARLLRTGYDRPLVRRLILTNWLRTTSWTLRAAILTWLIAKG